MKLRNKKTGEIAELIEYGQEIVPHAILEFIIETKNKDYKYNTLAELKEEWEDYEKSKDFYYIQPDGDIHFVQVEVPDYDLEKFKKIGNYFETKEEAEKTLKKLKAIKILKDKGVYFELDKTDKDCQPIIRIKRCSNYTDYPEDILDMFEQLYVLFGKEENGFYNL